MKKICPLIVFVFFLGLKIYGQHSVDFRSKTGGSGSCEVSKAGETYAGHEWTKASIGISPGLTGKIELKGADVNVDSTGYTASPLSASVQSHLHLIGGLINNTAATAELKAGMYAIGPKTSYDGYIGTFPRLTDAITKITSVPLTGNIIFEFQPDYKPSVETYPLNLNSTISGSETSTITFRPASTVNSVINFSTSGTVVNNSGADYIIFDGRNGGIGSNQFLQFDDLEYYQSTILISKDALHNKFLYCIFKGSTTTNETGILTIQSPVLGNNFNTVDHCDFNGYGNVNNCIFTKGVTSDLTITNCNFFDFRKGAGINIFNGSNNAFLDHNNFYQTKPYTGFNGTTSGIIINGGDNCVISNNNIGGNSPGLNGTWMLDKTSAADYSFTGINATLLATTSKIYNNRIQNFYWKSNLSTWTGINVSGTVNVGTDGANYIGNNSGNDNILLKYYSYYSSTVIGINSAGAANIENNIIGSITTQLNELTSSGVSFTGINSTGSGKINQNTIGSSTVSNSVNISPQPTAGYIQNVYGIYSSGVSAVITNNIVANINNASTVSSGLTRGIIILNITNSATVSSNNIHSISTSQPVTSSGNSASLDGINIQSTNSSTVTISGNLVYDLINLSDASISINGIVCNCTNAKNTVDKNYIHSFKSASNTAIQNGINIPNGGATFQNNVIRLGIDISGNSITSTAQINGITKTSSGSCHFYFNTVYIGGSNVTSGSVKTYALYFSGKSGSVENLKNNIFVNSRTNNIPNKLNYAVLEPLTTSTNWSSDYNIYYVTPTDGKLSFINKSDVLILKDLQNSYTGTEMHSGFGDPLLSHPTDAFETLDLKPANFSPVESAGIEITGITDDITGTLRNSNTPVDIGAYSGNFGRDNTTQNIFYPVIQCAELGNTCLLTNRLTKNFAAITDNANVISILSGTKPRLYYKLDSNNNAFVGNTASDNGWKWVEATGISSPFDFNIDYSLLFGGPVVLSSNIQYFVVAQDTAIVPNVTFNPPKGAAGGNVSPEGMKAPGSPYSYTIVHTVPSTLNVGTGQTYDTLTGKGGVFEAINTGAIVENTKVIIKSKISEPGTYYLNQITEDGPNAGTLTMTIQSDGNPYLINGLNLSNPLIHLSGVKRLKIDGGATKLLTFRTENLNPLQTKCVFQFDNSCRDDSLVNCIIESNLSSSTLGAINIGADGTNNVTILQNDIRDARGSVLGSPTIGISSNSVGSTLNIIKNNIYNLKNADSYGIYLDYVANGCSITGNSFYMEHGISAVGSFTGIWVSYSNNHFISENYVGGSAPKCGGTDPFTLSGLGTFTGISTYRTSIPEVILQGNTIQNVKMTNTSTPVFYGINNNYGPVIITSNTIGSNSVPKSVQIAGTGISAGIIQSYLGTINSSTIEKNTIANISLINSTGSPTFCALNMDCGKVRMNTIFNIGSTVKALTPVIYGINNSDGVTSNEFSNNVISLNGGEATGSTIYGIYEGSSLGSTGYYYNSINIVGTASNTASTYALYRCAYGTSVLNNNIFVNTRTGGTGKHYAIYSNVVSGLTSDFNDLYVAGSTLGHYGSDGTANDITTLSGWKNTAKQDANSICTDPLFNPQPYLIPENSSPVNSSGIPVATVITDLTGKKRNPIVPTLGAYELDCIGVSDGGTIKGDQLIGIATIPELIASATPASGYFGKLEYKWQNSVSPFSVWNDITTSNMSTYQPGLVTETILLKRLARTTCMTGWSEAAASNVVTLTFNLNKWMGASDSDWNNPVNWTLNKVPEPDENIVFADHPLHECTLDQNRTVNDITNHQSDYNLNINGKTLTVKGDLDFTNGAQLKTDTQNSTLVFSGSTFQPIPSNLFVNNQVYNLTVDNAAGVSPASDFTVSHVLTINAGKQLIIPSNRFLTVTGSIINNAGTSGLILKTNPVGELPNGSIIFHNDMTSGSNLPATVEMYSKASKVDGYFKWQFFGIPLKSVEAYPTFNGSYVREMHEEIDGIGHWEQLQNESVLQSFRGYEITQETAKIIRFEGNLENADFGPVQLSYTSDVTYKGQHLIGNPYTAAITIRNDADPSNSLTFGEGMNKTVYLYNTGSIKDWSDNPTFGDGNSNVAGQYLAIPQEHAGYDLLPSSIPSMQAFLVMVKTPGPTATIAIPYSSTGTIVKNSTLQRVRHEEEIFTRIDVEGAGYGDRMWIFTNPACSRGFNNGWDGLKLLGSNISPQIFAVEADGDYQVNTIDDINNTYIGFKAGIDTIYSLTFTHQKKDPRYNHLYLMDVCKNKTVEISSTGSTYNFNSESCKDVEKRFKIIATYEDLDINTDTNCVDNKYQPISVFNSGMTILIKNQSNLKGSFSLFNIAGRLIQMTPFQASGITTLKTQIPTGLYLVKAITTDFELTKRLMLHK